MQLKPMIIFHLELKNVKNAGKRELVGLPFAFA
jgi:hypothetical protein